MLIPSSSCFFIRKLDGFQKCFVCKDLLNSLNRPKCLCEIESSLAKELKLQVMFCMADLYMKLNEIQKKLQGKNVSMIQARTVM